MNIMTQPARLLLAVLLALAAPAVAQAPADRAASGPPPDSALAELAEVRARLAAALVPDAAEAPAVEAEAARLLAAQRPDGTWPDVDYADRSRGGWAPLAHLERLRTMARAWAAGRAPDGLAAVERGLGAWGRLDPQGDNWWHNQIGAPALAGDVLVLTHGALAPAARAVALGVVARSALQTTVPWQPEPFEWTGTNRVWMATNMIKRGVAMDDPAVLDTAFAAAHDVVRMAGPGEEGLQPDFSYHQHGPVLHVGAYGIGFLQDAVALLAAGAGTRWAMPPERRDLLERFLLDAMQWTVQGRQMDYSVVGRALSRPGYGVFGVPWMGSKEVPLTPLQTLAALDGPRQPEIAAFEARVEGRPAPPLVGARAFWASDYYVHRRPGYLASVRAHSVRTGSTDEAHNGENPRGHLLGDGATFVLRDGDEYRDVLPLWDWDRVPGVTAERGALRRDSIFQMGTTAFVGAASDGLYGVVAYDHARDGLRAHKAWVFFDDAFVALGEGIVSESGLPVVTSIEQAHGRGSVEDQTEGGWRAIVHDGVGYVVPADAPVVAQTDTKTGRWSDIGNGPDALVSAPVFSAWWDHGASPDGAAYTYLVVPTAGTASGALAQAAEVEVVRNDGRVQAARHRASGVAGFAFWRPDAVAVHDGLGVEADEPVLVLVRETGDGIVLTVADPTHRSGPVHVTLQGEAAVGLAGAPGVAALADGVRVRVERPAGPLAGSSVVVPLRRLAAPPASGP